MPKRLALPDLSGECRSSPTKHTHVGLRLSTQYSTTALFPAWLIPLLVFLEPESRDLYTFEIFSGSEAITDASNFRGAPAMPFDIVNHPDEDFTTEFGFLRALWLLLRVRRGGLFWSGIQCSSWIFFTSSQTRRCKHNPEGDRDNPMVQESMLTLAHYCILLLVAYARNVYWVVEQPGDSRLYDTTLWQHVASLCQATRVWTWQGAFGADCHKATCLWGTVAEISQLARSRPVMPDAAKHYTNEHKPRSTKRRTAVTGAKSLKSTEAYPTAFAEAIIDIMIQHHWPELQR